MRPGNFWLALLDDVSETGSPIIAGPFTERTYWPPEKGSSGWKDEYEGIARQRYDVSAAIHALATALMDHGARSSCFDLFELQVGDCALLLRHYYHRVPDDPEGLTFVGWAATEGEKLVVNSCEVCERPSLPHALLALLVACWLC